MNKNYYRVKCKCGHVGRGYYIPIDFPVIANSAKEAAQIARFIPRCKHHHKDCILEVSKINYDEFIEINRTNSQDPYLQCKSIQQQRKMELTNRIVKETKDSKKMTKQEPIRVVYNGKTKIKKPKKYNRFYYNKLELCYTFSDI